jgi:alginate O-acetyltransferase complex protein AlgI
MTFNSLQYAAFLPVVLIIYWRLRRRGQNVLLLVASYLFYGAFDWRFLGLLMISTGTDYTVGRLLEITDAERRRKQIFACSLVVNLGILGFFKYWNFFTGEGTQFFHHLGLDISPPLLKILLPIGISFYTFHGMSYAFDVYRKHIRPTHNLLSFAVFVAFFPQLVAGPIGRAHLQLPQFERDRVRPDWPQTKRALLLILQGLFKKIAIADALSPFVSTAFGAPTTTGSASLLIGLYAFALEIYGDFSGYSDIARGSAFLLGIDLPENFNQPYLSRSITEFWRRWHISLSTWLRDYLYIPLGGNRDSRLATYRNLLLTMLIGGLWHGASMTFVVWGGLHGLFLVAERQLTNVAREDPDRPFNLRTDLLRALVTFHLVCLTWVFFRAPNFSVALHYLAGIVKLRPGPVDVNAVATLAFASIAVLLIDAAQHRTRDHAAILRWPPALRGTAYGAMLLPIIVFSGGTPVPFIYFRF